MGIREQVEIRNNIAIKQDDDEAWAINPSASIKPKSPNHTILVLHQSSNFT